jgi:GcrA cell cycle regulator
MTRKRWTAQEDAVLREGRAAGRTYRWIADGLPGRDMVGCRVRAQKLGLAEKRGAASTPARAPDSSEAVRGVRCAADSGKSAASDSSSDPALFSNTQRLCAAACAAETCVLSRDDILTLPGRSVAGATGRAMSEARWSVALALSEVNDRDVLDIHIALGWSVSRSNARASLKRLLCSGWRALGVSAIVSRLKKACPYHDQRLADGPPRDPDLVSGLTGDALTGQALITPVNCWSEEELAVLKAACPRGPTMRQLGSLLPGRSADACRLEAIRHGWYVPRTRKVSEFNGAAARRAVPADSDPDVQLGEALTAAYLKKTEGRAVPSLSDPVLDLEPRQCRWPVGQPGEADFHFCCAPTVEGRSYCASHKAAAIDRVLGPIHSEAGIPRFRLQNRGAGRAA